MSREVLQMALDALEHVQWKNWRTDKAIAAIRAELAKPEPEDAEPEKFCEFSSDLPIRNATPSAPE